jgi:hypothetical protein
MPPAGLDITFPANERLQVQALESAVSGIGWYVLYAKNKSEFFSRTHATIQFAVLSYEIVVMVEVSRD